MLLHLAQKFAAFVKGLQFVVPIATALPIVAHCKSLDAIYVHRAREGRRLLAQRLVNLHAFQLNLQLTHLQDLLYCHSHLTAVARGLPLLMALGADRANAAIDGFRRGQFLVAHPTFGFPQVLRALVDEWRRRGEHTAVYVVDCAAILSPDLNRAIIVDKAEAAPVRFFRTVLHADNAAAWSKLRLGRLGTHPENAVVAGRRVAHCDRAVVGADGKRAVVTHRSHLQGKKT